MKNTSALRFWTFAIVLGSASIAPMALTVAAQAPQAATQSLLDKAHALEVRGRTDMAAQTWQQVLLADPNNTEALGGLARAYKLEGKSDVAATYLQRLKAINPNDPGIARAEGTGTQQDHNAQLAQAGKLAQQGQYAQAMDAYKKLYGENPPPGDIALAYYETEAATEDGRPHAIAGLRNLAEKNPGDSKYQVTLGRILTYNPKTRAEGRKLLAAHPADPLAVEALRQSLLWDAQNPAMAGDIREYLAHHEDQQLAAALRTMPSTGGSRQGGPVVKATPQTPEQRAASAAAASRTAADRAAYAALNAKHLDEAEQKFKAILATTPDDANALAGMGYVRMQQANFGGAISFLAQAKQDGSKDPGIDNALTTSRFWYTMGEGAISLNENDLPAAEKQYRTALAMRPTSVEALEALGGTLLKAQQPEAAIPYFAQFVKLKPSAPHAWRGLFLAQYGAGFAPQALASEKSMPQAVRAELEKDPLYLRSLSSAYTSVGRDADAQRVLNAALNLPFPADARGLEVETQLQYAGLLQAANHLDQAAGLYRNVLAKDQNNTEAWQGLVRIEHSMGQDEAALQTLEGMPPPSYAKAMREPGFESTVAGIYENQKRYDVAQDLLEKSIAQQISSGQKPAMSAQLQLAGLYMTRNNPQKAYPIYRQLITEHPDRTEAWKGLLTALHDSGRDTESLAEIQQIPPTTRAELENDVAYLQTVGAVYNALGQPAEATVFLRRVQQHYANEHTQAPADVDIQNAWLLYNGMNDTGLHRQLLMLGSRNDLTDPQRRTVQTIWANWAVRRANQAASVGDNKRALAILNATARAFPDNNGVIKALAGGYSRAGMPKQAVLIWKAQDLKSASASDYKAAVGAALAAGDTKDAEAWLRFGLDQYPKDAEMLILAAKFEQASGNNSRAADYYRASLDAMPPPDPGAELATELSRPVPMVNSSLPSAKSAQDLATLLAPNPNERTAAVAPMQQYEEPVSSKPYLPSYNANGAPVQLQQGYQDNPTLTAPTTTVVPSYMASPAAKKPATATPSNVPRTRLRDYVPQASLDEFLPLDATQLPESVVAANLEGSDSSGPVFTPAVFQQQQITRITDLAQQPQQSGTKPPPLTTQPASVIAAQQAAQPGTAQQATAQQGTVPQATAPPADTKPVVDPATGEVYGPYVPYKPVQVQMGATEPTRAVPTPEVTDVLPTARQVPNAKTKPNASSHPEINAANAAAIRARQSDPTPASGQSHPPAEDITTAPTTGAQYTGQQYPGQVAQPSKNQTQTQTQTQPQQQQTYTAPVQQTGDSNGQQYPQPYTGRTQITRGPSRARPRSAPAAVVEAPAPVPGMSYPGIGTPLGSQPYPVIGPAYPLGTPPSDYDLQSQHLPPLLGRYQGEMLPALPLTQRQQAERDLATLEASYSGWIGGTASARYRSGIAGLDSLTDLEATVEASATISNRVRFTIVPRTVFLNSGTLNVGNYAGLTSGVPVLGTLPANAANAPAQQSVSGIGGEFQVAGTRFAAAVGYTPYEFLVRNFTGRFLFKPSTHFTLYANRDSVTETELSYSGLRDPGTASAIYGGNIWGGVISTGGGLRFDMGDERAGFYITADGADLTGYHVLENNKFEGSAGAYFLAHTFPGYGKINIGASIFGMHYAQNERGLTYGLGGYFSPDAYFLASVPVTFTGRYGSNFHYTIAGSLGVQTFQEDSQLFFPLDRGLQSSYSSTANGGIACTAAQTAAHTCAQYPVNSNTGGNYGFNAEGAYRIADHWFAGGFISANNTNNYNTVTGGFFVRYLFRPQTGTDDYPTGLFPVDGFRPLRVP